MNHQLKIATVLWAATLGLGPLTGCAQEPSGSEWLHLAQGFTPSQSDRAATSEVPNQILRDLGDGANVAISSQLSPNDWEQYAPGLWRAPRPLPMRVPSDLSESRTQVEVRGELIGHAQNDKLLRAFLLHAKPGQVDSRALDLLTGEPPGYVFIVAKIWVYLYDSEHRDPPETVILHDVLSRGREDNGTWRVLVGDIEADGIPVLPGQAELVRLPILEHAMTLRFATAAQGYGKEPLTFQIRRDDKLLFEHKQRPAPKGNTKWHAVDLSAVSGHRSSLMFEVHGEMANAAYLNPVLGPATSNSRESSRPDIIIFLADTFRADNLARHGGDPSWTPALNAFAENSVIFEQAHSASTWTLPSHATLFSGLQPYQCGATDRDRQLPTSALTIAEHLAAQGYRTAAVTERGYVSRTFGMSQGFQWFQESSRSIKKTMEQARALIDARDDRPLFLFVHSYRTHAPYSVSNETRLRLGLEGADTLNWESVATVIADHESPSFRDAPADQVVKTQRNALALYRGGAADLDLEFGRFEEFLRDRKFLERGYLIFTSDHGEAFWEHGIYGHGKGLWEEVLHVPLIIHGPELNPRSIDFPVSQVELAGTLCRLAGVPTTDAWLGDDLLSEHVSVPVFGFECDILQSEKRLSLQLGSSKIVAVELPGGGALGPPLDAFDLAADPSELDDQAEAAWAAELARKLGPEALRLLIPSMGTSEARPDSGQAKQLGDLGYAGD